MKAAHDAELIESLARSQVGSSGDLTSANNEWQKHARSKYTHELFQKMFMNLKFKSKVVLEFMTN